jgi:hypothetical protein
VSAVRSVCAEATADLYDARALIAAGELVLRTGRGRHLSDAIVAEMRPRRSITVVGCHAGEVGTSSSRASSRRDQIHQHL